jgi:hypothetical protein
MKKTTITLAVLLAFGVAQSAMADHKTANSCAKTVAAEMAKAVTADVKVINKCGDGWRKCELKTGTDKTECQSKLTAAGKACSTGLLDLSSADSKVGKPIDKMLAKLAKKCDPGTINDATKLTIAEVADALSSTGLFSFETLGLEARTYPDDNTIGSTCALPGNATMWAQIAACIEASVQNQIAQQVADVHPGIWAILFEAGAIGGANTPAVPLGKHAITANATAQLQTAAGAQVPDPFTANLVLDVGAVGTDGTAPIRVDESSFSKTDVGALTAAVCVNQTQPAEGKICCKATGCGTDKNSYDVARVRGTFGGACTTSVVRSLVGLDLGVSSECSADSACNLAGARCTGGTFCYGDGGMGVATTGAPGRNTAAGLKACAPATLAAESALCTSDIDCGGVAGSCKNRAASGSALPAVPCTGAETVTGAAGDTGFANGEMVIALPVEIVVHSSTATFGADGTACTDDDTAPASSSTVVALTTGTVTATLTSAFFSTNYSDSDAGVVPSNACKALSVSVAKGYKLAGAFTATGSSSLGDTTTKFVMDIQ